MSLFAHSNICQFWGRKKGDPLHPDTKKPLGRGCSQDDTLRWLGDIVAHSREAENVIWGHLRSGHDKLHGQIQRIELVLENTDA